MSVNGKEEEEAEAPANALEFTHKVSLDVLAPLDLVWAFWTDIKSAPLWSVILLYSMEFFPYPVPHGIESVLYEFLDHSKKLHIIQMFEQSKMRM